MKIDIYSYDNFYHLHDTGDLFHNIFRYLPEIEICYPKIHEWFDEIVIPDLKTKNRFIVKASIKGKFAGYMILKKTDKEEKICTLQVKPEYRNIGIGKFLMKNSFQLLSKPLITVSEIQIENYKNILSEYNFTLLEVLEGAYNKNLKEYVFKKE